MKSFLISLFLLLGMTFYSPLKAQPPQDSVYLYIETESHNDTIDVFVRGLNLIDIQSGQFFIRINKLEFEIFDIQSYNYSGVFEGVFAYNPNIGSLGFSAVTTNGQPIDIPDGEPLLSFKLKILVQQPKICIEFFNLGSGRTIEFVNGNSQLVGVRSINSCDNFNLTKISGIIYADLNDNCLNDNNESGLQGAVVNLTKNGNQYDIVTNKKGEFIKYVETGIYEMSVNHPSLIWKNCTFNTSIDATDKSKTIKLINYLNPIVSCSSLEIELTNNRLRICSENNLSINYFNYGTVAANNSFVELKIDPRVQLVDASTPFIDLGNNLFRFDIGTINAVESGIITATIKTTCDVEELNKSICMEARIYPNEYCGPVNPLWSGADLKIDSRCVNDNVEFTIKNIGKGNMTQELNYAIVEDDLMPNGINRLKLNQNESKVIEVPANGKTIRMITDTIPNHPYKIRYSSAIEACGINNTSKGFISKFSYGDEDPHLDILCNTLRGSYDPNDKTGIPLGSGIENNIQRNDRIQYLVRFQNTGTDTAFKVEVVDTISEQLDLATLKIIGASHPFTWSNKEDRTLKFLFNKIKLVDSTTNEKESNGYIQYSIMPKQNIPYKTKIFNYADIYFDFNPPIRTNTSLHTISEPITITSDSKTEYDVNVYPNPTSDEFIVDIKDPIKNLEFELVDVFGRKIINQYLHKSKNHISIPNSMLSGSYYYSIKKNNQIISTGNIIKHK